MDWEDYCIHTPLYCRVAIVPVTPIKKLSYGNYVKIIKNCSHERARIIDAANGHTSRHGYLETFQPWRKTLAVVGVMDAREWVDVVDAKRTFRRILKRYPGICASTLFAFNSYGHEQEEAGFVPVMDDLDAEETIPESMQRLWQAIEVHLTDMLTEVGTREALETPIDAASAQRASSPFPIDPDQLEKRPEPTSSPASFNSKKEDPAETKARMRKLGRRAKLSGDINLLLGQSELALTCFDEAVDKLRVWSDFIWLGSALEGRALTRLVIGSVNSATGEESSSGSSISKLLVDTANEFAEALAMYAKASHLPVHVSAPTPAIVYLTGALRCTDLLMTVWTQRPFDFSSKGEKSILPEPGIFTPPQISRSILRAYGDFLTLCSTMDHFVIISIVLDNFRKLGMKRRVFYFQYEQLVLARRLMKTSQHESGRPPSSPDQSQGDRQMSLETSKQPSLSFTGRLLPQYRQVLRDMGCLVDVSDAKGLGGDWNELKAHLLRKAICEALQDDELEPAYLLQLLAITLGRYHTHLDLDIQHEIATMIKSKKTSLASSMIAVNFERTVLSLERCITDSSSMPALVKVSQKSNSATGASQWNLVQAKSTVEKRSTAPPLIALETAVWKMSLANPLKIPLELKDITLHIEPRGLASVPPLDTILAPEAESAILLTLTPLSIGTVKILGVRYSCWGLKGYHKLPTSAGNDIDHDLRLKGPSMFLDGADGSKDDTQDKYSTSPSCTVDIIDPMPRLYVDGGSVRDGRFMLFEGESDTRTVRLTNVGHQDAQVLGISSTKDGSAGSGSDGILSCDLIDLVIPKNSSADVTIKCHPRGPVTCTYLDIQYCTATQSEQRLGKDHWTRNLIFRLDITMYHILEAILSDSILISEKTCLVLFDVKNVYGSPFEVGIQSRISGVGNAATIIPGSTHRIGVLIERFSPSEMIQWWTNLTNQVHLTWREESQRREGVLTYNLSKVLSPRYKRILSRPLLGLALSVENKTQLRIEETVQVVCNITNLTDRRIDALLHLSCGMPSVYASEDIPELDPTSVLLPGSPTKRLPTLDRGEMTAVVFSVIFLATGQYTVKVFTREAMGDHEDVEHVHLCPPRPIESHNNNTLRVVPSVLSSSGRVTLCSSTTASAPAQAV